MVKRNAEELAKGPALFEIAMNADCDGQAGIQELAGTPQCFFICQRKARKEGTHTWKNVNQILVNLPASHESQANPRVLFLAVRPKTFLLLLPCNIGKTHGLWGGQGHAGAAFAALAGALLIQIGTNFAKTILTISRVLIMKNVGPLFV
ncbi:MAG: hypothetical protein Ct9H300mP28_34620 [Pseudomonadota bacterium]|nr:MAG: hypothetical protein Ct9H300mP28_34620 [Pseudomonadota bacterium]